MPNPDQALLAIAAELREERNVISERVTEPAAVPVLGILVAAGPRATGAPGEYAQVVESVREGYLLHYGEPRLLAGVDADLALLAGDYLYALGLARLASLADLDAVGELADLISLCSQVAAEGSDAAPALWLASVVTIATGRSEEHEHAKQALRQGATGAVAALWRVAAEGASRSGLDDELSAAAEAVGFRATGAPE